MKDLSEARRIVEQQRGEIERLKAELADMRDEEIAELRQQRDKLLAALEKCRDMVGHPDNVDFINATMSAEKGQS